MKEVYLTYVITDSSEFVEVFKKEEDAENYIRERAKNQMINMEDHLDILEGRDYNKRLYLTIIYKNEDDPAYKKYAELHVVRKDLR